MPCLLWTYSVKGLSLLLPNLEPRLTLFLSFPSLFGALCQSKELKICSFKAWIWDPNSIESCLSQKPLSSVCLGCSQAGSCLFSVKQRMKPRYMTCYLHTWAFLWEPFHPHLANFQARLQQDVNRELPDVQAGFRKGRGTWDQIANICWIMEKAREFQKNIYFCFIDYAKAFDCVDHNKLWKILKEMGIPDHLTCLLRNLYAGQEATVRTGHGNVHYIWLASNLVKG